MGKNKNRPHNNHNQDNQQQNRRFDNNQQPQKRPPKAPHYRGGNVNQMGDINRMGKYAIGIFKDMAKGRAKPYTQYTEFSNIEFLRAAIDEVNLKIREQSIYAFSLKSVYGQVNDIQVRQMIEKHDKAIEAWQFVYGTLVNMLNTGDASMVLGLINRLPDYRYVMY